MHHHQTGRYGHKGNPKATWDWYQIGGRWRGFFPLLPGVKTVVGDAGTFDNRANPGRGDVVRLADVDMGAVARETAEAAERFWIEWQALLCGKKFPSFEGPRHKALSIGLLRVEQGHALSDHCQKVIPWAGEVSAGDPRASWHDVAKLIGREKFMADYMDCFCPIKTYAALDNDGWHAPGAMGWWGYSSDEPDAYVRFAREFMGRFVSGAAADDTLVVVDYHI